MKILLRSIIVMSSVYLSPFAWASDSESESDSEYEDSNHLDESALFIKNLNEISTHIQALSISENDDLEQVAESFEDDFFHLRPAANSLLPSNLSTEKAIFAKLANIVSEIAIASELHHNFIEEDFFTSTFLSSDLLENTSVKRNFRAIQRLDSRVMSSLESQFPEQAGLLIAQMLEKIEEFKDAHADERCEVNETTDYDKMLNNPSGSNLAVAISFAVSRAIVDVRLHSSAYQDLLSDLADAFSEGLDRDFAETLINQIDKELEELNQNPEVAKMTRWFKLG